MSTPAGPASSRPTDDGSPDRRRSISKYVKRMSSVFRRDKSSKKTTSSAPATTPAAPASKTTAREEATTTITSAPATSVPATSATPAPAATGETPVAQPLNRSALQQERARALFAKYGLTLESHEWVTTTTTAAAAQPVSVQRVEKPIRMRVHRSCHNCGTSFGAEKVCVKCEHKRCKKCPRYPKKKPAGEKGKQKEVPDKPRKKKKPLTITSKSGGELIYQPVRQRVRRTCHKCQTFFIPPTATICEGCRHVRCTKCPREPAKLGKWPDGYPGDAEPGSDTEVEREPESARRMWRKPRIRVRWECEECHSLFTEGSPHCPGCGHQRCEKCTRKPLKRVKKEREFDPEVVKAVEAKLRALALGTDDDPATSATEAA